MFPKLVHTTINKCNTSRDYDFIRAMLWQYGIHNFHADMVREGWFEGETIAIDPNPLAQLATGQRIEYYGDLLVRYIPEAAQDFFVAKRPDWLKRDAMGQRHELLLPKDSRWRTFNVLTMDRSCVPLLDDMEAIAKEYTHRAGWSEELGLYFHCYPFNSIHWLHLHMVDLSRIGPSYYSSGRVNLSLKDVRDTLI